MMCHKIGRPPISTIGLGRTSVSSARRVPSPPARMPTFITTSETGPASEEGANVTPSAITVARPPQRARLGKTRISRSVVRGPRNPDQTDRADRSSPEPERSLRPGGHETSDGQRGGGGWGGGVEDVDHPSGFGHHEVVDQASPA